MQAPRPKLLKKDSFGQVTLVDTGTGQLIRRDTRDASWAVRWLARKLLAREARALAVLEGVDGVPQLISVERETLDRCYVAGLPMHVGKPTDARYFREAARLLRQIHRHNVTHNDLAKEPNLLLQDNGSPAFIDFQLSWFVHRRGWLFRVLAREDIRHLLKHKRTYCPERLTRREKFILNNPSILSKIWMRTVKPVYLFITRQLLGWQDREGAGDRGES